MGVKLKDLAAAKEITIDELKGKVLAVDALNCLFQFLTTIRQPDGRPLIDSHGHITSHLNGLFYRTTKLMEYGIKLVFVYDGKPPALKANEIKKRAEIKHEAEIKYKEACERNDLEAMRKYASMTTRMTDDMLKESKELLEAMGIPVIQAPSEGEAQAAYMTQKLDAFAVVSQDYDSLLSGAVRVVRNLSIEGRRKLAGKLKYDFVKPEMIILDEFLKNNEITQDELIVMGILIGTDYNNRGVYGIGPRKALKLVKQEKDFNKLFEKVEWSKYFDYSWKEVFDTLKNMPVIKDYKLKWDKPDADKIKEILLKHDFSVERVESRLKEFMKETEMKKQMGLGQWC